MPGHVVITGAAGFVGSRLAERCLRDGARVVGVDALTPYYDPALKRLNVRRLEQHAGWELVEGDLNELALAPLLAGAGAVFHLAARPGVRGGWGDELGAYLDANVLATERVLQAAREARVPRLVFASSSSVYGDAETLPAAEETAPRPLSPYAVTKASAEALCALHHRAHGVPVVTVRLFTVYGPGQRPDMAFHRALAAALDGGELPLYGDGGQSRDFLYVDDAVDALLAAGRRGRPGRVYNAGTGRTTALRDVLALVSELTGTKVAVRPERPGEGEARHTAAAVDRARDELGFVHARGLREGLARQLSWQRDLRRAPRSA